ncbi:MAG: hypothetical protein ACKO2O_04080 [Crocinitomicaceae bacterium]
MRNYILLCIFILPIVLFGQKTTLSLSVRTPYCGGAKPTPEMAAGTTKSFGNQRLIIQYQKTNEVNSGKWNSLKITVDSNGNWKGKIPKKSNIRIFLADQFLNLSELKSNYSLSDTKRYTLKDDAAIELWKSKPIYEKSVKEFKKSIQIELLEACFVGLNPCYWYSGPKPR